MRKYQEIYLKNMMTKIIDNKQSWIYKNNQSKCNRKMNNKMETTSQRALML